jgi:hypothetical protein
VGRLIGRASASAVLVASALLFASACGREPADQTAGAPSIFDTPLPEPGAARVEFADGRVSVFSNGAQRLVVLRQLAEQVGFELVIGDLERRALKLRIEDAELREALGLLLRGVRYDVEYDYDAGEGSHALSRLTVGEPIAAVAAAPRAERRVIELKIESAREEEARNQFESYRERLAAMSPEERQRLRDERAARAEAMEEELIAQLGDPDPMVRADVISELPLGGEGQQSAERLERIARAAADDIDPLVRIAALDRLGEADSPEVLDPLVAALGDPDRQVVLEVLDVLQDRDDASVIPYVEPLLQDPDPDIREEAEFTIEWLGW